MKISINFFRFIAVAIVFVLHAVTNNASAAPKPWDNGRLQVSADGRFLMHAGGQPFFWLGDTGWLLPERLNRDEADYYLKRCAGAGFNVVQVQVINAIPAFNAYGSMSMPHGFDFSHVGKDGVYGYWDHLDYIIDRAAAHGIYIGMVCIWGGMVKAGKMNEAQARSYGTFLANRYKDKKNIVWIMGGDIQGNIHPEVWDALATTIKNIDTNHLMTFHPRGRTTSAQWFNNRPWLDFNMFQSGHRRYGQRMGNKDYPIPDGTEEDSWMYVDSAWSRKPMKPVLDGEPSYEDIPQGLHDADEPRWTARDVRRYAYWSVFAGSCGHTYGHNAIMQFVKPGIAGAYFADGESKPWYRAMDDPGYNQMKYVKHLMLALPYFDRRPDQSVIRNNGLRYDRLIATRGNDYLLVYNHTGRDMTIDLTAISGGKKNVWWMNPTDGRLTYLGEYDSKVLTFRPRTGGTADCDGVLIAIDSSKKYLDVKATEIPDGKAPAAPKDRTE
ncbi:MAG: glycoside hydrolase family 140 protein [Prevotella sp.]|nr:glycoside hydrolase family 140 protein [Prevotella sp.]